MYHDKIIHYNYISWQNLQDYLYVTTCFLYDFKIINCFIETIFLLAYIIMLWWSDKLADLSTASLVVGFVSYIEVLMEKNVGWQEIPLDLRNSD